MNFRIFTSNSLPFDNAAVAAANTPLKSLALASLLTGALVLATEPAMWLIGTWYRDGYDGIGWFAFLLAAGLFLWSWSSPVVEPTADQARPLLLLLVTALLRLASQLLDISIIGALLLAVDVYALARMARLDQRRRRISALWLAVLFCFSLPIEPMTQRLVGFDLQLLSARIACLMLWPFTDSLACDGVRLLVDGKDVLVDLPCSGAELLSVSALIYSLLNAWRCPDGCSAVLGGLGCLLLGLSCNGLRITLLSLGLVHAEVLPFDVMAPVPHSVIGLMVTAMVAAGLYQISLGYRPSVSAVAEGRGLNLRRVSGSRLYISMLFLPLALLISALRPQPVDASPQFPPPEIPLVAAGFLQRPAVLTPLEAQYFTQYGGSAVRAGYGPFGLLVVNTASPLRHLHDPAICLSGAGYEVRLLGTDHRNRSTLYRIHRTGVERNGYLVRVSYVSNDGRLASSVAEVVWHWLRDPGSRWTMVQRVTPLQPGGYEGNADEWEQAIRRAFNLIV